MRNYQRSDWLYLAQVSFKRKKKINFWSGERHKAKYQKREAKTEKYI